MGKLAKLMQVLYFVLFATVIGVGAVVTYPRYAQAQSLRHERDQLRQRIADKSREIASIRDRQRRFTTDREFVEALARENRRVYPNELVFVFEN